MNDLLKRDEKYRVKYMRRHVDIYFASYKQMSRYNSNYQTISRVTFPFGKPGESEAENERD